MPPRAQQHLLLEAVLPTSTVEVVRYRAVFVEVVFVVGVEQVEVCATHLAFPYPRRDGAARHGDLNAHPAPLGVSHGRDREFEEVLRLVCRLLRPGGGEFLCKVAVSVQQSNRHHRYVAVARLLEVVACQNTEATRVYLQRGVQPVLHAEVGDRRPLLVLLFGHVGLEQRVGRVEFLQEILVFLELHEPTVAQSVEELYRIAARVDPQCGVDVHEQFVYVRRPRPPQVARQRLERTQPRRQVLFDHQARPGGRRHIPRTVDGDFLRIPRSGVVAPQPCRSVLARDAIPFGVEGKKLLPLGLVGQQASRLPGIRHFLERFCRKGVYLCGYFARGLLVVVVGAHHHAHSLATGRNLFFCPRAESGEGGGECRHREGDAFERSVAPRFVVRRVNRDVHPSQQLVVVHIEDAVGTVEICRHKYHLHPARGIEQYAARHRVHDRIPLLVGQIVGRVFECVAVDGLRGVGQMCRQIAPGAVVTRRYGDVGEYLSVGSLDGELFERLEEYVEPLVLVLVPSAGTHY